MRPPRSPLVLVAGLAVTAACAPADAEPEVEAAPEPVPAYVFTSDRDGAPEIYVRSARGTVSRLTDNEVTDYGAVWSPGGEQLAFVRHSEDGGADDIWVMDADGGNQRPLTEPAVTAEGVPVLDMAPAWSPDGERIVFASTRDGGEMKIYVMNADGSDQTRLSRTDPFVSDHTPSFSPDGRHIVFASNRVGASNTEIFRMRADGSDVQRLTTTADGVEDSAPEYSPDGTRILFSSTRGGEAHDLYTMAADGSDVRRLSGEPGITDDVFGRWTADGEQVLFQTFGTEVEGPPRDSAWIVDADGSNRRWISDGTASDNFPDPLP